MSGIDLEALDKDGLERVKLMLDISKIQADIKRMDIDVAESRSRMDKNQAAIEEMRANAKKIEKEARLYPFVTLAAAMMGGFIVFVLTRFFPA